ncbi:MAG: protoheme IX farnesyltransferase [Rubrivivax sp.]|nr:protoheme IX farnesyltransferase [Rubrivivax sp.]
MKVLTDSSAAALGAAPVAAGAAGAAAQGTRAGWRTVLGIFKLRIGVLIMVTALGGYAAMPAGAATGLQVFVMALGVLVAAAAAGAFNQFVEADSDRLMPRTRGRAFASGALPRSAGWLALIGLMLAAAVAASAWFVNPVAAGFTLAGALTYAGVYTLGLKRRTAWNIVIGGLSGSFAVLAGAAAASPALGPGAWALALVLFLWTPPHFWSLAIANEAEYRAAGVPMLPVVVGPARAARIVHANAMVLVAASLLPLACGAGWVVAVGALAGGAHFLRKTHALARAPGRKTALGAFFASMVQLSVLLAAVVVDAAMR